MNYELIISLFIGLAIVIVLWHEQRERTKIIEQELSLRDAILKEDLAFRKEQASKEEERRATIENWIDEESKRMTQVATTLGDKIGSYMSVNTKWASDALKEANLGPHKQTVFGMRIRDFTEEKICIAREFMPILKKRCDTLAKEGAKVLLFIDSGTGMYFLFKEFAEYTVSWHQSKDPILQNLTVATNNLPGVETLIEDGRTNASNRYAPLAVQCRLLPGIPLPVYSAVLGQDTIDAIRSLKNSLGNNVQTIALLTGNWIKLRKDALPCPIPLARGGDKQCGHKEVKQAFIDVADEIYVLAPLGKIFVGVNDDEVNTALGFHEGNPDPDKQPYSEVEITDKAPVVKLISTSRKEGRLLRTHSIKVAAALGIREEDYSSFIDGKCTEVPHILFPFDSLPSNEYEQMNIELPHARTRLRTIRRKFFSVETSD